MKPSLNRCPGCRRYSLELYVYAHVKAPASLSHRLSKRNLRRADVRLTAVLWETEALFCPRCGYLTKPSKQVHLT